MRVFSRKDHISRQAEAAQSSEPPAPFGPRPAGVPSGPLRAMVPPGQDPWDRICLVYQRPSVPGGLRCPPPFSLLRYRQLGTLEFSPYSRVFAE